MADNNIGNIGNINPSLTQGLKDVAAKNAPVNKFETSAQNAPLSADRIEISSQAKTIGKALTELNALPDVRQNQVDKAIQARVIEGNNVPAATLAAKLLMEG